MLISLNIHADDVINPDVYIETPNDDTELCEQDIDGNTDMVYNVVYVDCVDTNETIKITLKNQI